MTAIFRNETTFTIERHMVDGFTVWYTDPHGYVVHRRFIDYTPTEAIDRIIADWPDMVRCSECELTTPEDTACWNMATPVCPSCFASGFIASETPSGVTA